MVTLQERNQIHLWNIRAGCFEDSPEITSHWPNPSHRWCLWEHTFFSPLMMRAHPAVSLGTPLGTRALKGSTETKLGKEGFEGEGCKLVWSPYWLFGQINSFESPVIDSQFPFPKILNQKRDAQPDSAGYSFKIALIRRHNPRLQNLSLSWKGKKENRTKDGEKCWTDGILAAFTSCRAVTTFSDHNVPKVLSQFTPRSWPERQRLTMLFLSLMRKLGWMMVRMFLSSVCLEFPSLEALEELETSGSFLEATWPLHIP